MLVRQGTGIDHGVILSLGMMRVNNKTFIAMITPQLLIAH